MTLYDLISLFKQQNIIYGTMIDDHPLVVSSNDALFNVNKVVVKIQLFVFIFFFCVPFVSQLFSLNSNWVLGCNISCLITILGLGFGEYIQFRAGLSSYFENTWNMSDMGLVVIYIIYFCLRLYLPINSLIPDTANTAQDTGLAFFWAHMNLAVLFLASL